MTLQKAINIKENHQSLHLDEYYSELLEADRLSINAMKYIDTCRHNPNCFNISLLPGETDEHDQTREQ